MLNCQCDRQHRSLTRFVKCVLSPWNLPVLVIDRRADPDTTTLVIAIHTNRLPNGRESVHAFVYSDPATAVGDESKIMFHSTAADVLTTILEWE